MKVGGDGRGTREGRMELEHGRGKENGRVGKEQNQRAEATILKAIRRAADARGDTAAILPVRRQE